MSIDFLEAPFALNVLTRIINEPEHHLVLVKYLEVRDKLIRVLESVETPRCVVSTCFAADRIHLQDRLETWSEPTVRNVRRVFLLSTGLVTGWRLRLKKHINIHYHTVGWVPEEVKAQFISRVEQPTLLEGRVVRALTEDAVRGVRTRTVGGTPPLNISAFESGIIPC